MFLLLKKSHLFFLLCIQLIFVFFFISCSDIDKEKEKSNLINAAIIFSSQKIIVDHTVVEKYSNIPQHYIDEVKKMWLNVPGESHSYGYRRGLELLEAQDSRFQVNVVDSGTPEAYTDQHLRISRATWTGSTWIYNYGEEDFFTNTAAITSTKNHITYSESNNLHITAMGFGWCWDMTADNSPGGTIDPIYNVRWAGRSTGGPEGSNRWGLDQNDKALTGNSICMDTYLNAVEQYNAHAATSGYTTKVFFTTGPVDGGGNTGENGYQRYLKHQHIRAHVQAGGGRVLFDYADILCWSNAGDQNTVAWNGNTFPYIHSDNMLDLGGTYAEDGDHIGERGAVRLAKALWWMLARMAGWNGI